MYLLKPIYAAKSAPTYGHPYLPTAWQFASYSMTFTDYLTSKKIDAARFAAAEPQTFAEWAALFDRMHPESFTVQKKFLLNPTRRKYLLR